ncbi:MAG TPA: LytTR family transcriptional regulator [Candidatus Eisenbergiella merdipullorum]|uniref:LytTR family transcriptional regulator n=1 Tax=Candidatus Eisenbergiella merdipullorum TaxID=2838553 RepID=A0A9D2I9L7_9FIRM|nr:LytTR family transcriptional regulator [Candidatus Eisenbergiella merdipullorum]
MKVKIEIEPSLAEDEVIIRCRRVDEAILKLQQDISETEPEKNCIALQDMGTSYFVPLDEILFFETEGKHVQAHTASRLYLTEHKLYELEDCLPGSFMRISKSTIVNLEHIYSITKNLAASSAVAFYGTPKKVYVSRNYYKALIERLGEKRRKL